MTSTFTITSARNAGEKPNTHPKAKPGSTLVKWYLKLADSEAGEEDVYVQKQPGNDLAPGMEITGRLEKGEYGWRLFPESQPGNFPKVALQRNNGDERSRRIERQHSQEMAIRTVALYPTEPDSEKHLRHRIREWTDHFQQDLDADVGGEERPSHSPAADMNAESSSGEPQPVHGATVTSAGREERGQLTATASSSPPEEASPAQKRRLTNEFKKVGLVPEVMKAVVMVRCRSEKATKDGASSLIQDLVDGATAESLLAEVYDAKRAGDPVGIRAAKLIPENSPVDTEGLPELDAEGKQILDIKDEEEAPF